MEMLGRVPWRQRFRRMVEHPLFDVFFAAWSGTGPIRRPFLGTKNDLKEQNISFWASTPAPSFHSSPVKKLASGLGLSYVDAKMVRQHGLAAVRGSSARRGSDLSGRCWSFAKVLDY